MILDVVRHELAHEPPELAAAWVYGSTARGDRTPASDMDVALLHRSDPPHVLDAAPNRLEDTLERGLGLHVEALVLNRAPVDWIHRVLLDGELLLDRDRSARIAFEVKSRAEYFDLPPNLELHPGTTRRSG